MVRFMAPSLFQVMSLAALTAATSRRIMDIPLDDRLCLPDVRCKGGLVVQYLGQSVGCGQDLEQAVVADAPELELDIFDPVVKDDVKDSPLLVLMLDADAPSAGSCPDEYWLHWMAEAELQKDNLQIVRNFLGYSEPNPPSDTGPHRYQVMVFKLRGILKQASVPTTRSGFNLDEFTAEAGLHLHPFASFQFTVTG